MATGTITSLRLDRGFGFIKGNQPDDGHDELFFHHTAVVADQFVNLNVADAVTFDVVPDPRNNQRRRAVNVAVAAPASEE
jgi:CspA family cold shock protein